MTRILLAVAAASMLWFTTGHSGAQPPAHALKPHPALAGWPREAKGYGKTVDDAKVDAMKEAVKQVARCLKTQDPPLTAWQPDEEFVRNHLLQGQGELDNDFKLGGEVRKVWVFTLVQSPDVGKMVQLNQTAQRRELSMERQTMAGYGLAGLCLLLVTGWGYLRLDEWTAGRFSKWLGIGAVALVGLTGFGWWLSS
jgi:hypothetical protein